MKSKIILGIVWLFLILVFLSCCPAASAKSITTYKDEKTGNQLRIDDNAELLSEEEELQLVEDVRPNLFFGHVAILTINDTSGMETKMHSEIYIKDKFQNEDSTVIVIDMANNAVFIGNQGKNAKRMSMADAKKITDKVCPYISKKNYYKCCKIAAEDIRTSFDKKRQQFMLQAIIGTVCVSLFLLISAVIGVSKQKSENKSQNISSF